MNLPDPGARYERQNEAQARQVIGAALDRLTSATDALTNAALSVVRVTATGNVTISQPRATAGLMVLDVSNTTAGAITVTLGAGLAGTFAAPSAGKRRTQLYRYDRGDAQYVPVGAQSPDF